jgi:phosphotransacetylase
VLDAEMVSGAVEDYDEDGEPYIQINYVELGGRIVSVRVYEVLEARIVLADAEGHPAD